MEAFEEFGKLEDMEMGRGTSWTNSALSHCRNLSLRIQCGSMDLFDAAIQRQIAYFFTSAGSLAGPCMRSRDQKESTELCKQHAIDAQKGNQPPSEQGNDLLRDLRKLVSKSSPRPYPELDGTARTQRSIVLVDACHCRWP